MYIKKITSRILFVLLFTSISKATVNDSQIWTLLTVQGKITPESQFGAYLELQPRYSENSKDMFETLWRPALFYKTENSGSFFLGYLQRFNSDNKQIELRYWTQWLNRYSFEDRDVTVRVRLEQRDVNNFDKESMRARLMVRAVEKSIVVAGANPFGFVELFQNLNSVRAPGNGADSGFQQSRLILGLTRNFDNISADIGYLKNYIDISSAGIQDNNALFLALGYNF
ncbi:MAG: DUF2490 domain-containing protein [Bdellovibrionales bacterium]